MDDETELLHDEQMDDAEQRETHDGLMLFGLVLLLLALGAIWGCTPMPHIGCIKANTNEDCNTFG